MTGKKIQIGTHQSRAIELDINEFLRTKMLIQANSGGGKSYAIRKILEESHKYVQQIVIDPEGEFYTLREKYDYVLIGKDGDIPADIRSAHLLPEKILDLGFSCIIDLYEMSMENRIKYVRYFLEALVDINKKYWKPCLVLLDEAHIFAPEKGEAESLQAVNSLCTRGRKRGFGAILATQRISKLHKNSAAELNNKLIGRTGLDIDMRRVADELGFSEKKQRYDLRKLPRGHFFAFGPAISDEVVPVKIGTVKTTHIDIGESQAAYNPKVIPPKDKIKKILSKLSDLPVVAEKKKKELEDLQKENTELRKKIKELEKRPVNQFDFTDLNAEIEIVASRQKYLLANISSELKKTGRDMEEFMGLKMNFVQKIQGKSQIVKKVIDKVENIKVEPVTISKTAVENYIDQNITKKELGLCARLIGNFIQNNPLRSWSVIQIGILTGYVHHSGNFLNEVRELCRRNLILKEGRRFKDIGADYNYDVVNYQYSINNIRIKLDKCAKEIYDAILPYPDTVWTADSIANHTQSNYISNSGHFLNMLRYIVRLGVLTKKEKEYRMSEDLKDLLDDYNN